MEAYVKESLYILDYDNNIVDAIFLSDDHITAGYAYDITIIEANTGYSDLKFNMPNMIIDEEGNKVHNPKLKLLTPLVKLRYQREVYYMGDTPIKVREPQGYGDTVTYIDKEYKNTFPDNRIERYVMDYIVQPVDRKRDVLKLTTAFTAIDYPRFTLSKKKVGLTIAQDTLAADPAWSLFENKPMDVKGTIHYELWTTDKFGTFSNVTEWDPANAEQYPLTETNINDLINQKSKWSYGLLGTAFYWPIVSTGRFEGTMYTKGGYLVLQLYDFYQTVREGIDPEKHIGEYGWEWSYLEEVDKYLAPNNALNYLHHILSGTAWKPASSKEKFIKFGDERPWFAPGDKPNAEIKDGEYYIEGTPIGDNKYTFKIFIWDETNKKWNDITGKGYGATIELRYDEDHIKDFGVAYDVDIVSVDVPNPEGSAQDYDTTNHTCNINVSNSNCYNAITAVCQGLQLYPIYNCEEKTVSLKAFSGKNYGLVYRLGGNLSNNSVKNDGEKVITKLYVAGGKDYQGDQNINIGEAERSYFEPSDNPDERDPWNPNDPEYIIKRSPYGTNYILNFKWMYDNGWMEKEDILGLYAINQQIDTLNRGFMKPYTEDRLKALQMYNDAINDYDLKQGEYISTLNSMMNKYYKKYGEYSAGTFYAFHKVPLGTHEVKDPQDGKMKNYIYIAHCKKCGWTKSYKDEPTTCECEHGNSYFFLDEIYIPKYADFDNITPPEKPEYPYGTDIEGITDSTRNAYAYEPYLKGDYLKLLTTLDRETSKDSDEDWSITDYEGMISIIDPIAYKGKDTIDDREYEINGVSVKASSGNIKEWNEDIELFVKAYGEMLMAREKIDYCLVKLQELEEDYQNWKKQYDAYHEEIQKKYGDFIVEGNYNNNEQPYVELLFREGMEASDKFSIPEVTYNLDVIDSSGLIEYRMPQVTRYTCAECDYTTLEYISKCPVCQEAGKTDTTIIKDHDTYNDLVHLLHSVGQIVPKAGDYVTVYDEPMGLFSVPGMITEISRTLDKPINNKIKLDTGYTDDEELVGNIINATNTVLNHADIYARTAVLKADGTIDSSSISKTLDNPNANLSIIGTNGNMLLTGSYLRFTNPTDPTKGMKYSGTGIYSTTTLNENGVATEWQKMMTPSGINATYINAGQIDVKNVNIMSGMTSKVLIDQYGLVIKQTPNINAHITTFDKKSATENADYVKQWGTKNNIAGFMGVDPNNDAIIYTKGFLVAEAGSNIANWITSDNGFYHLNGTTKDLWLSPNGISGTVGTSGNQDFAIYSNGNFGVTTAGDMYARTGRIGGWNIKSTYLDSYTSDDEGKTYKTRFYLASDEDSAQYYIYAQGLNDAQNGYEHKFSVSKQGVLYAKGANIHGDLSAKSLTLADGIKIGEGHLILTDTHARIDTNELNIKANKTIIDSHTTTINSHTTTIDSHSVRISAAETAINGRVKFSDLSGNGTTTINGANIQTGTIKASSIDTSDLFAQTIEVTGNISLADGSFYTDGALTYIKGNFYTYGDGGVYNGWHKGQSTPDGFVVCRDIDMAFGQYVTMYFNNGIYVGFRGGRD